MKDERRFYKIELHEGICKELNELYERKNSDYGDSFGDTFQDLGPISSVTRIVDKVNRLKSLVVKSEEERLVEDETMEDTLMDTANYAIMMLIEMREEGNKNA